MHPTNARALAPNHLSLSGRARALANRFLCSLKLRVSGCPEMRRPRQVPRPRTRREYRGSCCHSHTRTHAHTPPTFHPPPPRPPSVAGCERISNHRLAGLPDTYATCSGARSSPASRRTCRSCTGRARCSGHRTAAGRTGRPSSPHGSDSGPPRRRRALRTPDCKRLQRWRGMGNIGY